MIAVTAPFLSEERRIGHPQGDILHAMKASSAGYAGFGEAYFTTILPGAIKGWKRHREMTLNLIVAAGRVRFVVTAAEEAVPQAFTLGPDNAHGRLTVPPGYWMAFQGLAREPNLVLNLANIEHGAAESENRELEAFAFDWDSQA